jgi:hypothetical protein
MTAVLIWLMPPEFDGGLAHASWFPAKESPGWKTD